MRSTTAPEMSAAVMIANVPWNAMKSRCGMLPRGSSPTPARRASESPPENADPGPNAIEYPASAQPTPTNPSDETLIISVLRAFLDRTRPP